MTKYLVFAWSNAANNRVDPADRFHGTTSELPEELDAPEEHEQGATYFPLHYVDREVVLAPNLLNGKTLTMKTLMTHGEYVAPEDGKPILAFLEIPGEES